MFTPEEEDAIKSGLPMFVAFKAVSEAQAKLEAAINTKQQAVQSAMSNINEEHDTNITNLNNDLVAKKAILNSLLSA